MCIIIINVYNVRMLLIMKLRLSYTKYIYSVHKIKTNTTQHIQYVSSVIGYVNIMCQCCYTTGNLLLCNVCKNLLDILLLLFHILYCDCGLHHY